MALFQKTLALDLPRFKNGSLRLPAIPSSPPGLGGTSHPPKAVGPRHSFFLTESGLLRSLKVREAIISFENQTEVWLPKSRDQGCSVIGKITQGAKADGKRLTRRLVTDRGELGYRVRDTRLSGTLVGAPMKCELGHILTYYDGSQPQFTHLRASMLAYAHINLLSMLQRFEPDEAVRVATDSIYVQKSALHKLEGVKAYVAPKRCDCGEVMCVLCLLEEDYLPPIGPGQWRDKGEQIFMPQEHAAYFARPDSLRSNRTSLPAPRRATMTRCRGTA